MKQGVIAITTVSAAILWAAFSYAQSGNSAYQPPTAPAVSPAQPASESAVAPHEEFLNNYCVVCHNQQARVAELFLDEADVSNPAADAETWEKVIRKLRAGAMPPREMPQPDAAAVNGLVSHLETSIDRAAAAQRNPGRPALHRLNRAEYENAIRDLLALDIDASTLLPPDDSSYGFDNIADVLQAPPVLLEQYLSASRKISRLAVGDPTMKPVASTYRTRPDLSQDSRLEGMPLGTRGGILVKHNFPLDGEYMMRVVIARNTVDVLRGLEEEHELEFLVDGERVGLVKIGGEEDTALLEKNPAEARTTVEARMQVRTPVKAGPHMLGVTFVKKNHALDDMLLEPFERITIDPVNEVGLPHIENLIVAGPYNATGSGETPSRSKIFTCRPEQGVDEVACAKEILGSLGRSAYRRPVTDTEMEELLSFYQRGRNDGGFEAGIQLGLRLILANPQFIFRFEREPANVAQGQVYELSDLELASRLSFFLWSSIPDEELLNTAIEGKLGDPAVLEQQVKRMLADERSHALVENFASQWLHLRNLKNTNPDVQTFPDFDDNLRQALGEETSMFVESIIREDRSVLDLLNADYTFVNERLAKHYNIPNIYGSHFRRIQLTDDARRGLLGQGSILSVTSYPTRTSPVLRGKWILDEVVGLPPPPPPPDVPALKENSESERPLSVRERLEQHRANPACASCHNIMDPLGFALENFDATGRWRDVSESGERIDSSGVLVDGSEVSGPETLREALLNRPDVFVGSLTEKLLTYALGRGADYYDWPAIRQVIRQAAQDDYRFSSVIAGIVQSTPFRWREKGPAGEAVQAAAVRQVK